MDWATEIAAKVQASLEGEPYTADDVERIAAALRAARLDEREACAAEMDRREAEVASTFEAQAAYRNAARAIRNRE